MSIRALMLLSMTTEGDWPEIVRFDERERGNGMLEREEETHCCSAVDGEEKRKGYRRQRGKGERSRTVGLEEREMRKGMPEREEETRCYDAVDGEGKGKGYRCQRRKEERSRRRRLAPEREIGTEEGGDTRGY
ncbi:hypothetical protein ACLOJK_029012 [Asimina triloba]